MAISIYMLWNARSIATAAFAQLLDRELVEPDRQRIRTAVLACEGVRNIHGLRTRSSGDRGFVEFHLEVGGDRTVDQGHAIADAAEKAVVALFKGAAEVTAHVEPTGINDERLDDAVRQKG